MNQTETYSDLPPEILLKIFQYLNFTDIESISLVCHKWHNLIILMDPVQNKFKLNFQNIYVCDSIEPGILYLNTMRKFRSITFDNCDFYKPFDKILKKLSESIETLELISCNLTLRLFFDIISKFKNLKSIKIENCYCENDDEVEECDYSSEDEETCQYQSNNSRIEDENKPISADLIRKLNYEKIFMPKRSSELKIISNLDDEIFLQNVLQFFYEYRSDYTHLEQINFIESHLPSLTLKIIELNKITLSELNLIYNYSDFNLWKSLNSIENLNLIKFKTNQLYLPLNDFKNFILKQKKLRELILDNNHMIHDVIEFIINNLKYLEIFKLPINYKITTDDLDLIKKIENLKILNIFTVSDNQIDGNTFSSVTVKDIQNTILNNRMENLMELNLINLKLYAVYMEKIIENVPNLEILNISCSANNQSVIEDTTVQRIIKNLKKLKVLNLAGSYLITDYGLTGFNPFTNMKDGYSLNQLKYLKSLNIVNCNKLTDATLINGITPLQLNELYLGVANFTQIGIELLAENCSMIEKLNYYTDKWNYLNYLNKFLKLRIYTNLCAKCNCLYDIHLNRKYHKNFNHLDKNECIIEV